ncbi:AAA family ATPase [Pseudomonas sp. Irchel s3b5]|uniref:AAA family ATPase n=1 Tax=Pseudomonas sp. Irchel s3b5 TaxID=2009077 RepID=UPI000BA4178D|nr:ATP-binding protein [Pseudomonas sp. Irchel s3b5]
MKLQKVIVHGLLGQEGELEINFNSDLNIITGRNGAGKTTLMKLIWYIISGNTLLALKEVKFTRILLQTDLYSCVVHRISKATCKIEFEQDGQSYLFEDDSDDDDGNTFSSFAEDKLDEKLKALGSSVFLPTFRRIEGGFTLNASHRSNRLSAKNEVEEALVALSKKLTNEPHVFVSAISTVDIVSLLLRQYTDLSEESNIFQQEISQKIIQIIKSYKTDQVEKQENSNTSELQGALKENEGILENIKQLVESIEVSREEIMSPLAAITSLVERLFKHAGIKFGQRLNFGDAANAISSDDLSAGEKQMLSFICYNAFYKNSVFIIDEPELSLHVDWQRQLFTLLQSQQTGNQFIIATHSPFIYAKYPDKEILLNGDRGEE